MGAFSITCATPGRAERTGLLELPHARVETPVFMPVGTQGTIKTLTSEEVQDLGYQLILGNTYHLHLRPGEERIARLGGLHRFMSWPRGILTDSGGFQVFSLKEISRITPEGVTFRSRLDGRKIFLSPEKAIDIQLALGSDVVMAFDECIPYPSDEAYTREATRRSFSWTEKSAHRFREADRGGRLFFGIVQGGMYPDLRASSAEQVRELPSDGLAVGGLSVGEPKDLMFEILTRTLPYLPSDRPRYLMGVGTPRDIVRAVALGVDMFDCVMPTRLGRHGHVFTSQGKLNLYNARFGEDLNPLDPGCRCLTCAGYSRAYVHHLFRAGEFLGPRLATYHNLAFYQALMVSIRAATRAGELESVIREMDRVYPD